MKISCEESGDIRNLSILKFTDSEKFFSVWRFLGMKCPIAYRQLLSCLCLLISLIFLPLSLAQANDFAAWTDSTSNPLFGGAGDKAYYPCVIKVGSVYHIWYGDGSHTRHASSTNFDFSGVTFPAPAVSGLVATAPYHPRVLYNVDGWDIGVNHYAGPFLMYYTDSATWHSTRVAHSADGNSWTDIGSCTGVYANPSEAIYNFDVLYEGGTTWKAYADNGGGLIEYYISTDGLNWTRTADNILVPLQGWETSFTSPHVFKSGSQYIMYYGSGMVNNQGIGVAFSTDGQNFTKSSSNPIFSITDGPSWRNDRTYTPFVIPDGASWMMYYTGRSSTGVYSIGYALPATPSGTNVTVTFPNGTTVTYGNVVSSCSTNLSVVTTPDHNPPSNFRFIRGGYFDIATNCSYSNNITITIPYDPTDVQGGENNLKLFHWKNNGWQDCTVSVNTVNNTITGRVTSLSPFGIGYPYSGSSGGSGSSGSVSGSQHGTGANENMIAFAILAIFAGIFLLRRYRRFRKV